MDACLSVVWKAESSWEWSFGLGHLLVNFLGLLYSLHSGVPADGVQEWVMIIPFSSRNFTHPLNRVYERSKCFSGY